MARRKLPGWTVVSGDKDRCSINATAQRVCFFSLCFGLARIIFFIFRFDILLPPASENALRVNQS